MEKIKVEEILMKHNVTEYIRQSDSYGEDDYRYDAVKAAIKEIVELAIDKCAEGFYATEKHVITSTKQMINYE